MFLHEEYLKRHGVDADWVGYARAGTLVFRSTDPNRHRWVLMSFTQKGPDYHPQEYSITTTVPRRNSGHLNGHQREHRIKWDEFELWVKEYMTKAHKLRIVKDPDESELTLWEIFVYCNDHWFSTWGFAHKKMLFRTLDLGLPLEERTEFFKAMMEVMRNYYSKMHRQFESNMAAYKQDGWIGKNAKSLLNSND
jgi:hypothetical protein